MGTDIPPGEVVRSIYIHIPFCLRKCDYCSFFSLPFSHTQLDKYHSYLLEEISLYKDLLGDKLLPGGSAITIYFGGGSPSLLSSDQINSIFQALMGLDYQNILSNKKTEITLEINPIQINEKYLSELVKTPVNRLSLGLQSMQDEDLEFLGRKHRSQQIADKLQLCRDFLYDNISLDLMYGLPGSEPSGLKANLEQYILLKPEHVSCYLLSLDPECEMYGRGLSLPDDESCALQYETLCKILKDNEFRQYEISNFARESYSSIHNLAYWKSQNYLALGAAAAGFVAPLRYQNASQLESYYASVDRGQTFPHAQKLCSKEQQSEYIMMKLRLLEGLSLSEYETRFGVSFWDGRREAVQKMMRYGMVELAADNLRLSQKALFVSNSVIAELI